MTRYNDERGEEPLSLGPARALRETDRALRVELVSGELLWVPKSVIHDDSEVWQSSDKSEGVEGDFIVKRWWAAKNGHA